MKGLEYHFEAHVPKRNLGLVMANHVYPQVLYEQLVNLEQSIMMENLGVLDSQDRKRGLAGLMWQTHFS